MSNCSSALCPLCAEETVGRMTLFQIVLVGTPANLNRILKKLTARKFFCLVTTFFEEGKEN